MFNVTLTGYELLCTECADAKTAYLALLSAKQNNKQDPDVSAAKKKYKELEERKSHLNQQLAQSYLSQQPFQQENKSNSSKSTYSFTHQKDYPNKVPEYNSDQDVISASEKEIAKKYYFNRLSEVEYLSHVENSFKAFLEFSTENASAAEPTKMLLRDAYTHYCKIGMNTLGAVWIRNINGIACPFKCHADDYLRMYSTEELAQSIAKKYGVSYENALLIVKFRTQHLGLVEQNVRLLKSVEHNFDPSIHSKIIELNQFTENKNGQLIYESYLIDTSEISCFGDLAEMMGHLLKPQDFDKNTPHLLSYQSFKITPIPGQEIPQLSEYFRFDTKRFEKRRKKLFDHSDCRSTNFIDYLNYLSLRPIVPFSDKNSITFGNLLRKRLQDLQSPDQFIDIFKDFPAQQNFKLESKQCNLIITNANQGKKVLASEQKPLQKKLQLFLKGQESSLSFAWQKTVIEVHNLLKQMLIHAINNFFDASGDLRPEIKAVLEKTYAWNINSWIDKFGKDKTNQTLFNSYFIHIYVISFIKQLKNALSPNDKRCKVIAWLFDQFTKNYGRAVIHDFLAKLDQTNVYKKSKTLLNTEKLKHDQLLLILENAEFQNKTRTELEQSLMGNKSEYNDIIQVNLQLHDLQVAFNSNRTQINPTADHYKDAYTKILLNQSRALYTTQLSWQQTKSKTQVHDAAIESVQLQQGSIQKLLFLNKTSPVLLTSSSPRQHLIDQLASVLNLNQELPLFSDADSVIDMARVNIEQKRNDLIAEIQEISNKTPNKSAGNQIYKMLEYYNTNFNNTNLRKMWISTKEQKPSFIRACINSVLRGIGYYNQEVHYIIGIAEREYLNQIRRKIKGFLINAEFEQSVINVINHFCSGKISQHEVVPLLKQVMANYEPYLLERHERLHAFCDSFSALVKQHAELYDNVQIPNNLVIPNDDQPVQQNLPPDPDTELAPFKDTILKQAQAINVRHCYQSAIWRMNEKRPDSRDTVIPSSSALRNSSSLHV